MSLTVADGASVNHQLGNLTAFAATVISVSLGGHLLVVRLIEALTGVAPPLHVVFPLSLVLGVTLARMTVPAVSMRQAAAMLTAIAILAIGFAAVASRFYDTSYDGQEYHMPAVIALARGWSPLHTAQDSNFFANVYPNGMWTLGATFYLIFGFIEAAKAISMVVGLAAFSAGLAAVFALKGRISLCSMIIVGLLVANPVVIAQLMTFYVDGILYLLLLIVLFAMAMLLGPNWQPGLAIAAGAGLVLVNTKLTGGIFLVAVLAFGFFCLTLQHRGEMNAPMRQHWLIAIAALTGVLAVGLVGFRPYATNLRDTGQVFFPSASWIMAGQRPVNLDNASRVVKLGYLVFGKNGNSNYLGPAKLKFPGYVYREELRGTGAESRHGGFGILFGLQFLAGILVGAAALAARQTRDFNQSTAMFPVGAALLLITLAIIFPEPWWARFVPFVWAVPLLPLLAPLDQKWQKMLVVVVLAIAVTNAALACAFELRHAYWHSERQRETVAEILKWQKPPTLHSERARASVLDELHWELLEGMPEDQMRILTASISQGGLGFILSWQVRLEEIGIVATGNSEDSACPVPLRLGWLHVCPIE